MSENKGGRPSDYSPKFCQLLIEHMKQGLSFESFGGTIGVSKQTLYNWEKVHPDFSEAKQRGQSASLLYWEKIGLAGTSGQLKTLTKEIKKPDGKVIKRYRASNFNATSWTFNMKNRFGWKERQEIDHRSGDGSMGTQVQVYLPKNGREADVSSD